jgi:hypothetical protein
MQKTKLKFTMYLYKQKIQQQDINIIMKFRPWDGCQMVNTKSLILYFGLKS